MRLVPIYCIKEGSYLAKTIYDTDGRVLLAKDVRLTDRIIKKVENIGVLSLYINDEYSGNEIEDIIRPELRQKAVKAVKDTFGDFIWHSGTMDGSAHRTRSSYRELEARHRDTENLSKIVNELIDELLSRKDVLINLVDIKSMDDYTYQHSVNVIILSLVLGIGLDMDRNKLYHLAMGAMLHDMGKVFIPKEVLQKNGKLTDNEFAIIKEHPIRGYEYLKGNIDISALSRIVVLQHHEKIDGTGYPGGIKGNKIHEFAKIAAIADVYDALTSDRPYRRALPPNEAIEFLMGGGDRLFDFNLVSTFVKNVVPYPVGTLVKLSNGDIAVVEEITLTFPLRPKVKVIGNKNSCDGTGRIDLMKENNIVIEEIQYEVPDMNK